MEINSKKSLSVQLSHLSVFAKPNPSLEQYPTDSEVAGEMLWFAKLNGDIAGKTIADFGCGTGILGIGCMLLGAKKVIFVDKDENALVMLKKNLGALGISKGYEIVNEDISKINVKTDAVFQNPPFGVQKSHADRVFLENAYKTARVIYSLHKTESISFISKLSYEHSFNITHYFEFDFPLKKTMAFHTKKIVRIKVGCWRMEKH
ncbi:MAG: METTL5 family protein [archaeon]